MAKGATYDRTLLQHIEWLPRIDGITSRLATRTVYATKRQKSQNSAYYFSSQ